MPGIAKRVRTLTIWPEDVCRAVYPEKDEGSHFKTVPVDKTPDTIWRKTKRRVFKKDASPKPEYTVIRLPDLPKPPARLRMFKQALRGLTNLEELSIKRRVRLNGNYQPLPPPDQMFGFLPTCMQECIWPAIKKSVRKLTLDVDNQFFEDFVPAQENFPKSLRHLVLRLWSSPRENFKMSDEVVPFVRQLSSSRNGSLEKLSLEGDCQALWSAFGTIPNLHNLELQVPAQIIIQQDTQDTDLHRLLLNNAESIQHLSVIPVNTPRRSSFDASAEPRWHQAGVDSPKTLHKLKSLKFKFPWRGGVGSETREWSSALNYYALLGQNATSLTVQDSLSLVGLESTLRAFNRVRQAPFQELHLNVTVLSPAVVSTITQLCPNLVKLDLVYGTLLPDGEFNSWTLKPSLAESMLVSIYYLLLRILLYSIGLVINNLLPIFVCFQAKFIQQIKERGCHPCPSLTDISLMTYVARTGLKYHLPLMKAYAEILPSIVSFAGIRDAAEEALAQLEPKMAFLAAGSGRNAAWS
jgi:hypothetical protein